MVDIQENEPVSDGVNIFFCAHLLSRARASEIPKGSIVYNFEQIFERSPWVGAIYRDLLSRVTIWDYSARNLAAIRAIANPRCSHLVPLGYVPQLTCIPPAPVEDIDVLFYGALTPRRRAILQDLQQAGLRLRVETGISGAARDGLISRAKVVLNLHFYSTAIFEIVRVSYLLCNRKAVVGECGPHTEIDDDIREAIAAVSYDRLCETVFGLLRDETERNRLAKRGQEIFAKRRLPDILARAIAETEADSRCSATNDESVCRGAATPLASTAEHNTTGTNARSRRAATSLHKHKRVLFHAINGNGLGHVVRLSIIAQALSGHADVAFYSPCRFADRYWPGRLFTVDARLDDRFELNHAQRNLLAFHLALNRFSPDIVVCDTFWPETIIRDLHERGIRTVLVLRALPRETMEPAVRAATAQFSSILVPHHTAELASIYAGSSELLKWTTTAPCVCIGPVARTTTPGNSRSSVIFTLGGGGDYWVGSDAYGVESFIREYRFSAAMIKQKFDMETFFAAGPFFDRPDDSLSPLRVIRSQNLHEMFGPDTLVVTRGGYNTCWEAVAAGARLIVVGEHSGSEDVGARGRFLEAEGFARHVGVVDASKIFKSCSELIASTVPGPDHYLRRSVNSGLSVARDEILGLIKSA
ncbi:hypothetical protein [Rhodoplanes sp. Z2-YC6860]|uniref:hypothetical protein n=1 Tax=Rhodoplanes sp. Z2-YC6860 TaxID=674703 RepID=UPI0012ECD084|nr:hypothetical protein [Rhodoplanes sp. Z2-YC6860]